MSDNDIVRELREDAQYIADGNYLANADRIRRAADEIVRLRAYPDLYEEITKKWSALRDEVAFQQKRVEELEEQIRAMEEERSVRSVTCSRRSRSRKPSTRRWRSCRVTGGTVPH